jgi:serine/threonine protein kinase
MVFLVRESKGRLCLTIRQKNNLGCAHSFIERGRNLYWTMRNGVKISAPTLFQLMVQLGLPLPAQSGGGMGGLQEAGQEMYQSVPDAQAITGSGISMPNSMGMGNSAGMGMPPMGSMGMQGGMMGNGQLPMLSSSMAQPPPMMTPGFMPNSLGRPPMPSSSPMMPNASQPRFNGSMAAPLPMSNSNKSQYAPAGVAARGVSQNGPPMSQFDDAPQQAWNQNDNQGGGQGGGGGGNRSNSNRDNVHLIDEQDIQLMKVNGMPERIGEGAYGVVYRGEWTFDKESADLVDPWLERRSNRIVTVAVKQLGGSSPDKEVAVWTTLRHPNIIPLFGLVDSLKEKLVMPYANGCSLRRRLTDLPQECSERRFQLRVLRDVAAGVAYLHEKDIVHRDLAARNVLLHRFRGTSPDQEVALLADFGLTRKIDAKAQYAAQNFNVPLQPLAPEQLLDYHQGRTGCRSSPQSDVWAFGVLCAEMLLPHVDQFYADVTANCGSNTGSWIEAVYQYVTVDCRTPLDDFNLNEATVDVVAVAKRCMQHNENTRPLMKEIYRQLREQCDQPEPKTVGDVPKALYGSSELDIVVREAIEGERQFARRIDVLFNVFEKELQASTMSDTPAMTIADIKIVFRNSGALYQAANALQAALAQCDRANFGATLLDALKKNKFDKVMSEYLKGVLQGQSVLYELMYPKQRANKKRAEALQLFLDQRSASRKAKGLNLPDLLSCPYAHLTEMKRMLARIGSHTDSKTDKAALDDALKLLDSISLDGEREVTEGQAKEIVQGLTWRKLPGDQYPLDANAKRNLLRMGELGVVMPGSRKPKSRTVYLFDDAIVVCDKKNAVALLELVESNVDCMSLGPSAFQVTARAIRDARQNVLEFVCEARRDALHWVDDIDYVVKNRNTKKSGGGGGGGGGGAKAAPAVEKKEERPVSPVRERGGSGGNDRGGNDRDRGGGDRDRDRGGNDRRNETMRGGGGGGGRDDDFRGGGRDDRSMSMRGGNDDRGMRDDRMMGGMVGASMPMPNDRMMGSMPMPNDRMMGSMPMGGRGGPMMSPEERYGAVQDQYWDQPQQQQQQQDWNRGGNSNNGPRRDPAYDQMRIAQGTGNQSGWDEQQQQQQMPGYTRGQPGGMFNNSGFQPTPNRNDDYNNGGGYGNNGGGGGRMPMGSMGVPGSMQIQPPGGMGGIPPPPMMMGNGPLPMSAMNVPPPMMGSRPMQNSMGVPPMNTAQTMNQSLMPMQQQQQQRQMGGGGGGGGGGGAPPGGNGRMRSRTDAMPNNAPMLNMMMSAPVRARSPSPQRMRQVPNSMGLPQRNQSMASGWDNEDQMTEYEDYDDDQNNYVALPDARGGGMSNNNMSQQQQQDYAPLPVDQRGGPSVISALQGAVQRSRGGY